MFGLQDQVDLIGGTFSKSLASIGGWLVGERKVLDYIRHFAPSFMFAAAAAPPNVAAAMAAFEVMQEESWRIDKLRENFTYMRDELRGMGFELGHTETAVIPIYIRQDLRTIMMWRDLLEEYGIYTNPFISPGVPPKSAMLRTSYMATHSREHLDRGLEAFRAVGKKYGVISVAQGPNATRRGTAGVRDGCGSASACHYGRGPGIRCDGANPRHCAAQGGEAESGE